MNSKAEVNMMIAMAVIRNTECTDYRTVKAIQVRLSSDPRVVTLAKSYIKGDTSKDDFNAAIAAEM